MPTFKQLKVAKKILENPRKSVSSAMRDVGYSPNTAVDPGNLTKSKGWNEIMAKYLPKENAAKILNGLLGSSTLTTKDFSQDEDDNFIKKLIQAVPGQKVIAIRVEDTVKFSKGKEIKGQPVKRVYYLSPKDNIRTRATDQMWKLSGDYAPEKKQIELSPLEGLEDDELAAIALAGTEASSASGTGEEKN